MLPSTGKDSPCWAVAGTAAAEAKTAAAGRILLSLFMSVGLFCFCVFRNPKNFFGSGGDAAALMPNVENQL
jgi:hypothetical protein